MIMLKDNHIDFCGGVEKAIEKTWHYVQTVKPALKIEVEARSIEDVKKIISVGRGKVFRILLDNFTPPALAQAVSMLKMEGGFETEGGSLYAKYRFFSEDAKQSHFRMALFARASKNRADIHQDEIETMGHNTGYEAGFIATKLLHKVAISSTISYERAFDNKPGYIFPATQSNSAMNYTFSLGKLMLPKVYTSYNQTNVNLMFELIGQRLNGNQKSFLDIGPSIQFIVRSQARFDIGYRRQLYSTMERTAPNGFILKFEYLFFNVFK